MTTKPPADQASSPSQADPNEPCKPPNQKALDLIELIAAIHPKMDPRPGKSSVELVREAREGAMHD
jgi:hypothetical protein